MIDPVWTKPVHESDRALDPLAMNRVTERMLAELMRGITTISPRARYYSFYLWAMQQITEQHLAETYPQFSTEMYRRERVFLLACSAHAAETKNPDRNHNDIIGTTKGEHLWDEGIDPVQLNFSFIANRSGGYGQAYRGPLASLGLVSSEEADIHEKPTPIGVKIVDAFNKIASSLDLEGHTIQTTISKKDLTMLGKTLCLCRLADADAAERDLLREAFFQPNRESHGLRESFLLILHIAEKATTFGSDFTDQDFLDACYYGAMELEGKAIPAEFPPVLMDAVERWRMFRAHDYLAYAAEAILTTFLDYIDENQIDGATREGFLQSITSPNVMKILQAKLGDDLADNAEELQLIHLIDRMGERTAVANFSNNSITASKEYRHTANILFPVGEHCTSLAIETALDEHPRDHNVVFANVALLLIGGYMRLLHEREHQTPAWRWITARTSGDLSPARFIQETHDIILSGNATLQDFLHSFVNKYVLDHAYEVYLEKSRYTTTSRPRRWFHQEGDFYFRDREWPNAYHRSNRFESATSILHDLGLVRRIEDVIESIPEGQAWLKKHLQEV